MIFTFLCLTSLSMIISRSIYIRKLTLKKAENCGNFFFNLIYKWKLYVRTGTFPVTCVIFLALPSGLTSYSFRYDLEFLMVSMLSYILCDFSNTFQSILYPKITSQSVIFCVYFYEKILSVKKKMNNLPRVIWLDHGWDLKPVVGKVILSIIEQYRENLRDKEKGHRAVFIHKRNHNILNSRVVRQTQQMLN